MKFKLLCLAASAAILIFGGTVFAQSTEPAKKTENPQKPVKVENKVQTKEALQHGRKFVDENGDGYNDNAPDDDGDGIPNGLDPDYQGPKLQKGKPAFVDLDGDGINDNMQKGKGRRGVFGPGNGNGKTGVGPQNGSGNGTGNAAGNNAAGAKGSGKGAQNGKK